MTRATACLALVDDDASVRIALGRMLRLSGYEVVPFASGSEFLASLAARQPDCIVLDVHMPGVSGLDVRVWMRTASIHVPIVFITASDDTALDAKVIEKGSQLLRKPFPRDALLGAVKTALLSDLNP